MISKARLKLLQRQSDFEVAGGHRKTTTYIYGRAWVDFGLFLRWRFGDGAPGEWTNRDRSYRGGVTPFALEYLEENIHEVTVSDVDAYVAALLNTPNNYRGQKRVGVSAATINVRLAALKFLFTVAIRENLIASNPASAEYIDRKKRRTTTKPFRLEREDVLTLIEAIPGGGFTSTRNRMIIKFLYLTGCRRDELVRLTIDDLISLPKGQGVAVTLSRKGDRRQNIVLSRELESDFVTYVNELKPSRFIFPAALNDKTPTDQPLNPNRITEIINDLTAKHLDRTFSPHAFRHAFCTAALEGGAPLHTVQQYLGHSDPKTTMAYYDSVLTREGSAAEWVSLGPE